MNGISPHKIFLSAIFQHPWVFGWFGLICVIFNVSYCSIDETDSSFGPPLAQLLNEQPFWVFDFKTNRQVQKNAYLLAQSEHTRIFIESDEKRYSMAVLVSKANEMIQLIDEYILPNLHTSFGPPSDYDTNPQVTLLFHDIQDGFGDSQTTYVGGYFNPLDKYPNKRIKEIYNLRSNEMNIVFLDTYPDLAFSEDTEKAMYTFSHEYYHLLSYSRKVMAHPTYHNPESSSFSEKDLSHNFELMESSWFEEGMAELAPDIALGGYRESRLNTFSSVYNLPLTWQTAAPTEPANPDVTDPNQAYLIDLEDVYYAYSQSYMFARFIADTFGGTNYEGLRPLLDSGEVDITNLEAFLDYHQKPNLATFNQLFEHWLTAIVMHGSLRALYGSDIQARPQPYRYRSFPNYAIAYQPHRIYFRVPSYAIRPNAYLLFTFLNQTAVETETLLDSSSLAFYTDSDQITMNPPFVSLDQPTSFTSQGSTVVVAINRQYSNSAVLDWHIETRMNELTDSNLTDIQHDFNVIPTTDHDNQWHQLCMTHQLPYLYPLMQQDSENE
jgi:hypothetical protein